MKEASHPHLSSDLADEWVGVCDGVGPCDRGQGEGEWHGLMSKKGFFLGAAWERWCARRASAARRFGAVLKAHAELGLGVPGSAEPQLGV